MLEVSLQEVCVAVDGQLAAADPNERVRRLSTDTRTIQPGDLFWALEGENFDGHDYCVQAMEKGGKAAVIQNGKLPGIEIPSIRVHDTLWALGELALHLRSLSKARFVGVTGSVGKSTTKEFIRRALGKFLATRATEGNLNNLIGVPKTIAEVEADDEAVVLELGIDRPGEMKRLTEMAKPHVGVVTAISEVHLGRLENVQNVFREKGELLKALPADGLAVVPEESPFRENLIALSKAPAVTFGTIPGSDYLALDPKLMTRGCYGFLLETPAGRGEVHLRVPGLHQVEAATAAAAVAVSTGFALDQVIEGLQSFMGLPGRCEIVDLEDGITLIADHYNANPVSMAAAQRLLGSFLERRKVFVAGEMWDLGTKSSGFHEMVGKRLGSGGIDFLVAVGPKTRDLVRGAKEAGLPNRSIRWFETTEVAAKETPGLLQPLDVVLVKGSRGMKLERVVDSLTREIGRKAS